MPWSKTHRSDEDAARSSELTNGLAGYHGPDGLPFQRMLPRGNSGAELKRRLQSGAGSRGGAPIWVAKKGWEPEDMATSRWAGGESAHWRKHATYKVAMAGGHARGFPDGDKAADPDGFAVFGRYPKGFFAHVVKAQWLGRIHRHDILHVCSGTLSESEPMTVDIRAQARPWVQASGTALPFRDGAFKAVMLDPPYSDEYARNLYKIENPRPSWLLKEAARVVRPGGRIGILHVAIPFAPPGCFLVDVWPVTTGVGFRIRALTVYEKAQDSLL